jgi:N-acetylglutamate synthase-like GNAT family acetyltransferase
MISYRKAEQEDLDEIMEVINDVSPEDKKESKKKIVERISDNQLLCVVSDNKISGFLGWDTKFQDNSEYWYLEQITIHPDYRGKGIGQNFVKYFLQMCRDEKVKKIFAHVQKHNSRSLNMFLKVGWTINEEVDKAVPEETTMDYNFK